MYLAFSTIRILLTKFVNGYGTWLNSQTSNGRPDFNVIIDFEGFPSGFLVFMQSTAIYLGTLPIVKIDRKP